MLRANCNYFASVYSISLRASRVAGATARSRGFGSSVARNKQNLVILGSGWGGYEVLRGVDKKRWDVTMLSASGYFNFTPLLAGCAVGTLEFRCAVEPVRRYTPQVTAYQAWCDSIDFKQKTLQCMPATPPLTFEKSIAPIEEITPTGGLSHFAGTGTGFTQRYDKLVIAVGAYAQSKLIVTAGLADRDGPLTEFKQAFNVPGVKAHAHFLKDVRDARRIRTRILECFEQANQPTLSDVERRNLLNFCIVGGGPTGVEFAAELHDLLHSDIRRHYPSLAAMAKINLYDVAPNILGTFDRSLASYAEQTFRRDGISIRTNHHVEKVEKGKMFVKEQGEVEFGLLVWSTGLAPNPLIASISELAKDEKTSSLLTDDNLNVITKDGGTPDPDVWAIGDAAVMQDQRLPATAQVANQKAKYIAKKLNKIAKGQNSTKPFEFHNQGSMAYVGNWKAIYDRSGAENVKTKESGRLAWLLWRSAYFTQTLSLRNKILVPTYWFLNWIFGRDLTKF